MRIAVNVSPQQLRHRDFVGDIRLAVGVDALAAAGLELEITESMAMQDFNHNITSLLAIRAMGGPEPADIFEAKYLRRIEQPPP